MRHIILSLAPCLAPAYFSTLFHKKNDFRKNVIEHKMRILIFSTTLSEIFVVLRRIHRDIVIYVRTSLCKLPAILVGL
jgi:hypothetical protein